MLAAHGRFKQHPAPGRGAAEAIIHFAMDDAFAIFEVVFRTATIRERWVVTRLPGTEFGFYKQP